MPDDVPLLRRHDDICVLFWGRWRDFLLELFRLVFTFVIRAARFELIRISTGVSICLDFKGHFFHPIHWRRFLLFLLLFSVIGIQINLKTLVLLQLPRAVKRVQLADFSL